jgi:hypothetical protein
MPDSRSVCLSRHFGGAWIFFRRIDIQAHLCATVPFIVAQDAKNFFCELRFVTMGENTGWE